MINQVRIPKYHLTVLAIGAFCLPIKLSFAYCVLIPLIIFHVISSYRQGLPLLGDSRNLSAPLILYFLTLGLLALLGLNPLKSIPNILCALAMILVIPVYAGARGREAAVILTALVAGQTIAGADSVLKAMGLSVIPGFFVGEVTESGQLALVVPMLFGLISALSSAAENRLAIGDKRVSIRTQKLIAILLTTVYLLACYAAAIGYSVETVRILQYLTIALLVLLTLPFVYFLIPRKIADFPALSFLILVALPILITTFIINLKRGPWAGVFVGLCAYLVIFRSKTVVPIIGVLLVAAIAIEPVRERLLSAPDHFFISGGRSEIWDIGAELITTYPLGIGFRNSSVLGKFSTDIPENLKHFHSNPINIAVESGMIGLFIFYWWILSALKSAWRINQEQSHYYTLAIGIASALISWQVAGLVEFNVGDSEVLYIGYVLVGILGALQYSRAHQNTP